MTARIRSRGTLIRGVLAVGVFFATATTTTAKSEPGCDGERLAELKGALEDLSDTEAVLNVLLG